MIKATIAPNKSLWFWVFVDFYGLKKLLLKSVGKENLEELRNHFSNTMFRKLHLVNLLKRSIGWQNTILSQPYIWYPDERQPKKTPKLSLS